MGSNRLIQQWKSPLASIRWVSSSFNAVIDTASGIVIPEVLPLKTYETRVYYANDVATRNLQFYLVF